MTKDQVVKKIREVLDDAYEEAAYLAAAHIEAAGVPRQTLCKEVCEHTPYSWQALDSRVRRLQARKAAGEVESGPSGPPEWKRRDQRAAKQVAREDPTVILEDPAARKAIEAALIRKPAGRDPAPVQPQELNLRIESRFRGVLNDLADIRALAGEADRPLDDEDVTELADRVVRSAEVTKEMVVNGKSVDTELQEILNG